VTPEELDQLRDKLAHRKPKALDDPGAKLAAVAAVVRVIQGNVEMLLIRRAEREGDIWSGHMAFPGGRAEPEDADLLATAIRETQEEVGLDLVKDAKLLGPLDEITPRTRAGLIVAPFVFELNDPFPILTPNAEVAEIVWAQTGPLKNGDMGAQHEIDWMGMKVKLPAFKIDDRVVWGMTHRMIVSMFDLIEAGSEAQSG